MLDFIEILISACQAEGIRLSHYKLYAFNSSGRRVLQQWSRGRQWRILELTGGGGGLVFLSLALPAFLPSAILFFFFTQNKGEARAPRGPSPRSALCRISVAILSENIRGDEALSCWLAALVTYLRFWLWFQLDISHAFSFLLIRSQLLGVFYSKNAF